jgi:glycosyltransferase involved in cell wall biosynthesis
MSENYSDKEVQITVVGHPFAPIGMGEHIRCSFRALRKVGLSPNIVDIYGLIKPNKSEEIEFGNTIGKKLGAINIFHINGDEVNQALMHIGPNLPPDSYNIIYPAWELERYPLVWANELNNFDEIWAPSYFIKRALEASCSKEVVHQPLACQINLGEFFSRAYFGLSDSDFLFLFFFDMRSYYERKNPHGVISAFRELLKINRYKRVGLVIKVNGSELNPHLFQRLMDEIGDLSGHIKVIDAQLTDVEVKNLVRVCECFVSLHRSEGFGRGMAEAMVLGKPVIATAYSGNMDFMNKANSFLVDYSLIDVREGEYPHSEGQKWAEPDVKQATMFMDVVLNNSHVGRAVGKVAKQDMALRFDHFAVGANYLERLSQINPLININ